MKLICAIFLGMAISLLSFAAPPAAAQDNYEIQVYGYDTVAPHHTMVEWHNNFTIDGSKETINGVAPTNHAFHETIEITHGFTTWFETGFYIFTSARSGDGWDWVGDHIRPRFRVPPSWHWPVGVSVSNEIEKADHGHQQHHGLSAGVVHLYLCEHGQRHRGNRAVDLLRYRDCLIG